MTLFSDLLAGLEAPQEPTPPVFSETPKEVVCTAALESIGHLLKKVELMWGSAELDAFISRLFTDSREGTRQGLPMDVAAELVFLADINKVVRAFDIAQRLNLSLAEAYRLVNQGDQARLEGSPFDDPQVSRDTIQRSVAQPILVSRRQAATDGSVATSWGRWFGLAIIGLIIAAVCAALYWPNIAGHLSAVLK